MRERVQVRKSGDFTDFSENRDNVFLQSIDLLHKLARVCMLYTQVDFAFLFNLISLALAHLSADFFQKKTLQD